MSGSSAATWDHPPYIRERTPRRRAASAGSRSLPARLLLLLTLLHGIDRAEGAEPTIEVGFPSLGGARFPNNSKVLVPAVAPVPVEIWLRDALGEVEASSVRVLLNETPMTPFVSIHPLPSGVKAKINFGTSLRPEYNLASGTDNMISFRATDDSKTQYVGRFFLVISQDVEAPAALPSLEPDAAGAVVPPPTHEPPEVRFTSSWPETVRDRMWTVEAEAVDATGLRRVVVEVNGKDVEEVVLQNGLPIRKQGGIERRGTQAGRVAGGTNRVELAIPVKLRKDLNVVAVHAESLGGLRARVDRTVRLLEPPK